MGHLRRDAPRLGISITLCGGRFGGLLFLALCPSLDFAHACWRGRCKILILLPEIPKLPGAVLHGQSTSNSSADQGGGKRRGGLSSTAKAFRVFWLSPNTPGRSIHSAAT